MNVFKKQLKLASGFGSMKKAVSTSDLSDKKFSDIESPSTHNLTLDPRHVRCKSPSMNSHEFADLLISFQGTLGDRFNNQDFHSDDLPPSLATEWINIRYSVENDVHTQKKNSAILELLTTELNYLNQMQFLLDVSEKVFSNLQIRYFSYINAADIFLNIGDIYEVNYQFWTAYLYPSFETAKENNNFISCRSWKNGFNQISSIFTPYHTYCSRMIQCQKYIQSLDKDKYFSQFLQWFSRTDQSNRESLTDFIAKPFQRLTKYKLLLTTISGYSDDEEEKRDLTEMINSINLFLKQVEWKLSMAQICVRLDPMEFVEPPNEELLELCAAYRHIDLTTPINAMCGEVMRQMIKEGTFKMKEAQMKMLEVSLIMFTDLILICQRIKRFEADRIKIIRPIIPLTKLNVINTMPGSLVLRVIDDFGCLTSMYLLTNDPGIMNEWINAIQNAQFYIRNLSQPKHISENKLMPTLRVNIINPSPISCHSPTPTDVILPVVSSSSQYIPVNRSAFDGSDPFARSTFRSSPVIRRRPNTNGSGKGRTESLHERSSSAYDSIIINRSISQQHYSKSQMYILEDECDDNLSSLGVIESSVLSIDLKSQTSPVLSESVSNGDQEVIDPSDTIQNKNSDKKSDQLKMMRAYGSMMSLSTDP